MNFALPEIQIAFIIMTALISIIVAFIIPHYAKILREFVVSRRLLLAGTLLTTLHFILQYVLHKSTTSVESTRILINMLFGFPISYFIAMSMLNIMRRGQLTKIEWLCVPQIYIFSLIFLVLAINFDMPSDLMMKIMATFYALTLVYTQYLVITQLIRMHRTRLSGSYAYDMMLKWTKWGAISNCAITFGLPLMAFVNNTAARSVYGILSIAVLFFFVIGMLGYVSNYNVVYSIDKNGMSRSDKEGVKRDDDDDAVASDKEEGAADKESVGVTPAAGSSTQEPGEHEGNKGGEMPAINVPVTVTADETRLYKVAAAASEFVNNHTYTRPGISLSDAAKTMNVSVNMLKQWLRTTEYRKFNNWIAALRIQYSKDLMIKNKKASNDVIAEKCGFCDRQYFQAMFMKHVGVRPSKWLRDQLEKEE